MKKILSLTGNQDYARELMSNAISVKLYLLFHLFLFITIVVSPSCCCFLFFCFSFKHSLLQNETGLKTPQVCHGITKVFNDIINPFMDITFSLSSLIQCARSSLSSSMTWSVYMDKQSQTHRQSQLKKKLIHNSILLNCVQHRSRVYPAPLNRNKWVQNMNEYYLFKEVSAFQMCTGMHNAVIVPYTCRLPQVGNMRFLDVCDYWCILQYLIVIIIVILSHRLQVMSSLKGQQSSRHFTSVRMMDILFRSIW